MLHRFRDIAFDRSNFDFLKFIIKFYNKVYENCKVEIHVNFKVKIPSCIIYLEPTDRL